MRKPAFLRVYNEILYVCVYIYISFLRYDLCSSFLWPYFTVFLMFVFSLCNQKLHAVNIILVQLQKATDII